MVLLLWGGLILWWEKLTDNGLFEIREEYAHYARCDAGYPGRTSCCHSRRTIPAGTDIRRNVLLQRGTRDFSLYLRSLPQSHLDALRAGPQRTGGWASACVCLWYGCHHGGF